MGLENLKPAEGSVNRKSKRLGRGQASGKGGTATRGHKGAKSRSGYSKKIGFEGGQMPLQRRIPKFGFKNFNRKEYVGINLETIQLLVDKGFVKDTLDFKILVDKGLVNKKDIVKILGRGTINKALKVHAHKFTASAQKAIIDAGGEAVMI